jgi:hypothetical protein
MAAICGRARQRKIERFRAMAGLPIVRLSGMESAAASLLG